MRALRLALIDAALAVGGFVSGAVWVGRRRQKPGRHGPPTAIADALTRAEKKLRQAEYFSDSLAGQTDEIAEFHFSACLSAVRSVFYILQDQDERAFQRDQQTWRKTCTRLELAFFKHMRQRRDDDVHRGVVGATTLPRFVDATRGLPARFRYLFNTEGDAQVEMENPDKSTTRAPALATEPTLYIEYDGGRLEATKACKMFIELMRALVGHVRARRAP
jgi:hypothetical protein